ncbi:M23 family metallopeptidase [Mycolicibacterium tusciae]|uniref:M23 family metallopeptidase n=1 Tax=Mycolicibacterium tusciae TaxID=75922 RepID=UPI00024A3209|nr:M23 family metallopeptidase [Mycolicibacterium tusciae]
MSEQRWPASPRHATDWDDEITEVIAFDEFGALAELMFAEHCAFDKDFQVIHARELGDDLDLDADQAPLQLVGPVPRRPAGVRHRPQPPAGHSSAPMRPPRRGRHRNTVAGAERSRVLIAAMAAGAVGAAAQSALGAADLDSGPAVMTAEATVLDTVTGASGGGMQVIAAAPSVNPAVAAEEFARGVAFAQQRAEREARLQRPLYVMPTRGILTSGYGYRWGALHSGIDIANATGTPIYALADGVVIAAGPVSGFGIWVKLRHTDGAVTLYAHLNSATVNVGERVMAGDQVATMGSTGNSTGPHLHLEVHVNGTDRVDPAPWLATRGLTLGDLVG